MNNTKKSFNDKWAKNADLVFNETLIEGSEFFTWILNRNGFKDSNNLAEFLKDKKRILDAGCGNGRVTALLRKYSIPEKTEIVGIDIVESAIEASQKNLKNRSSSLVPSPSFTSYKSLIFECL